MLIANPAAVFFRDLHYWSAQFFLAFTLLHLWDHIKQGTERKLNSGVWLRLTLSILFTFFVMITGFILKADADSIQARRILTTLISKFPLFGDLISYGLFGPEDDFQILYVHHIATTTIFLAVIIWEHAKTLWTKLSTFLITLIILTVFSLIFHAPIHNWLSPVVKGPWYFVGLQEVLHWVSNPVSLVMREINSPTRFLEKNCIGRAWICSNMWLRKSVITRLPTHSTRYFPAKKRMP